MRKSSIVKIIIAVTILLVTFMLIRDFLQGFREPVVFMDGDELIIQSSSYGVTVTKREINSLRLINEIPTLTRGQGFGVGNTQRGRVRVSSLGEGRAYVKVPNPPYIYLELNGRNGNYVFINLHAASDTKRLYESILAWLQS